jgi:hypothetical protein
MRILSGLSSFFLLTNLFAQSFFNDASSRYNELTSSQEYQRLRQAYDAYLDQRNNPNQDENSIKWIVKDDKGVEHAYLMEDDQSNRDARIMCQGCPSVSKLAGEVNAIVQKLVTDQDNPHPALLHEVGRLEGMYYLEKQKTQNTESGNANCRRWEMDDLLHPDRNNFERELAVLVWDKEVDMSKIGSIQMRMAGKRLYYFKSGYPPNEKVIRVQVTGTDKAKISYFHMVQPGAVKPKPLSNEEIEKRKKEAAKKARLELNANPADKPKPKNVWGPYGDVESNIAGTTVQGSVGLGVEHRRGLPRQVNIIDLRTNTELPAGMIVESEVKVNSRDQTVQMKLKDKDKTYLTVKSTMDDTTITVPYSVTVAETDIKVDSTVSTKVNHTDNKTAVHAKLSLSSLSYGSIADIQYQVDDEKTIYGVTRSTKLGDGTLTLGIENKSYSNGLGQSDQRAYFKYSLSF